MTSLTEDLKKKLVDKDPPILKITEIHSSSLFLQVEFEHEFTSFSIEIKKKSDQTFNRETTKNKFLYFDNLQPNTLYVLRALAKNNKNYTETILSKPIEVKTLTTPTFVR